MGVAGLLAGGPGDHGTVGQGVRLALPGPGQQPPVGARGPYGAVLPQEDDGVAGLQHQGGLGDDHRGASAAGPAEASGDPGLRVGVQGAGGLHQDEGGGLGQEGPRQGHALALAPRERPALLRDHARQARLQGGQDVPGVGHLQGGQEALVALGVGGGLVDLLVRGRHPDAGGLGADEVQEA